MTIKLTNLTTRDAHGGILIVQFNRDFRSVKSELNLKTGNFVTGNTQINQKIRSKRPYPDSIICPGAEPSGQPPNKQSGESDRRKFHKSGASPSAHYVYLIYDGKKTKYVYQMFMLRPDNKKARVRVRLLMSPVRRCCLAFIGR